jgi:hypothetical protein
MKTTKEMQHNPNSGGVVFILHGIYAFAGMIGMISKQSWICLMPLCSPGSHTHAVSGC